ncbi:hypothetical protein V8C26DRAFT_403396 [Trichoderma gracile]
MCWNKYCQSRCKYGKDVLLFPPFSVAGYVPSFTLFVFFLPASGGTKGVFFPTSGGVSDLASECTSSLPYLMSLWRSPASFRIFIPLVVYTRSLAVKGMGCNAMTPFANKRRMKSLKRIRSNR